MMPARLYARRYRNAKKGETEWHPVHPLADGTPQMYAEHPGPLNVDHRYEVQVVEYVLQEPEPEVKP